MGTTVFSPPQTTALLRAAALPSVPACQLLLEDLEFAFQYLEDIETTILFHLLLLFSQGRKHSVCVTCPLTVTEKSCNERSLQVQTVVLRLLKSR